MARQETILNVFISSPSDVLEDRDTVEEIIEEVNRSLSANVKVRLMPLRWESNVTPGIGRDPQSVINASIGNDYDVFVGIMGARFGGPTPRYGSGTEEEFTNAYKKHFHDPSSLRVLFYLKDVPVHPSKIDVKQLAAVNDFKDKLSSIGVLYSTYTTRDDFKKLLRIHFSEIVQTWNSQKCNIVKTQNAIVQSGVVSDLTPDDEPSFIDIASDIQDDVESLTATSLRMTSVMNDFAGNINKRTGEMNSCTEANKSGQMDFRRIKRICAAIAQNMDEFHSRLEPELNVLSVVHSRLMERFVKLIVLMRDNGNTDADQMEKISGSIGVYGDTLETLINAIGLFHSQIISGPRATIEFNKSRNRVIRLLDRLIETLTGAKALTLETQRVITGILIK